MLGQKPDVFKLLADSFHTHRDNTLPVSWIVSAVTSQHTPDNEELESAITRVPHPPLAAHRQSLWVDGALYGLVDVAGQHVVADQHVACGLGSCHHTPEADRLLPVLVNGWMGGRGAGTK